MSGAVARQVCHRCHGRETGAARPGGPVLIVQAERFNASAIQKTIAVVLSSNLRRARAPGNLLLKKRQTRLRKDSVVNVSQTVTLDERLLTERISSLPDRLLAEVDKGLRLVLDLW